MKKFLMIVTVLVCLYACTRRIYVPVEHTITVTKTERDTIIDVRLEKEVVRVETRDTTVRAETRYAEAAAAWSGEHERLTLDLRNKQVKIPVETKYIEVIRTDSVPYPVEVPVLQKVKHTPWYMHVVFWLALACIVLNAFGINVFNIRKLLFR